MRAIGPAAAAEVSASAAVGHCGHRPDRPRAVHPGGTRRPGRRGRGHREPGGVPGGAGGLGAVLSTGVAGCNPNFNYAVVGTITRWTPVKGLTFFAELAYVMFDQKFAGGTTFAGPAFVSLGKPAAVYEMKDQSSLQLLLRAQRNW